MSELVQRLKEGRHRLVYSRGQQAADLKRAIESGYVLLKLTGTRGGTELGVPLDMSACTQHGVDFEAPSGRVHLEGDLTLDYVRVRLIADLDVATLWGEGQLRVLSPSAPVS